MISRVPISLHCPEQSSQMCLLYNDVWSAYSIMISDWKCPPEVEREHAKLKRSLKIKTLEYTSPRCFSNNLPTKNGNSTHFQSLQGRNRGRQKRSFAKVTYMWTRLDHKKVATHLGWSSWPRRILAKAASSYNCANSPKFNPFPRPPGQKARPPKAFFRKGHLHVDPVGPRKSCDASGMVQLASADFSKSGL
jgi:hypothetical protein